MQCKILQFYMQMCVRTVYFICFFMFMYNLFLMNFECKLIFPNVGMPLHLFIYLLQ